MLYATRDYTLICIRRYIDRQTDLSLHSTADINRVALTLKDFVQSPSGQFSHRSFCSLAVLIAAKNTGDIG